MCGIVSYIGKSADMNKLMYMMHDNDNRGGHSSGAYIDGKIYKCLDESPNLLSLIEKSKAELFIGHTRYGTHGAKTAENTHPFTYGKYVGVHNGVLNNYEELLKEHELENVEVDSEAIYSILKKTNDYSTLGSHSGTINAVWSENNGQLYVYRRNNPLFRYRDDSGIYFSSRRECLDVLFDKEKVKEVTANKLFIYAANGELIESIKIPVTAVVETNVKNWYDYGNYSQGKQLGFNSWSKEEEELDKDSETLHDFGVKELYEEMYSDNWYITMQDGLELIEEVLRDLKAFNSLSKADEQCMKRFIECVEKQIWTTT
mgnify:CR=1 FL=1|tara:strand:- start:28 stop:975 length:948 start_codon:yes stop_codon:yes gene_type:complete